MEYNNNCLYVNEIDTLCVSDVHFDRNKSSTNVQYPQTSNNTIYTTLKTLLEEYKPETIIFNGDTYTCDNPSEESLKMMQKLRENYPSEFIFISGNHDDVKTLKETGHENVFREYSKGQFLFTHGHQRIENKKKYIIIGHIHPCIDNKNCFLKNNYEDTKVIVIPPLNPHLDLKDFHKKDLENISPFILEEHLEFLIPEEMKQFKKVER